MQNPTYTGDGKIPLGVDHLELRAELKLTLSTTFEDENLSGLVDGRINVYTIFASR